MCLFELKTWFFWSESVIHFVAQAPAQGDTSQAVFVSVHQQVLSRWKKSRRGAEHPQLPSAQHGSSLAHHSRALFTLRTFHRNWGFITKIITSNTAGTAQEGKELNETLRRMGLCSRGDEGHFIRTEQNLGLSAGMEVSCWLHSVLKGEMVQITKNLCFLLSFGLILPHVFRCFHWHLAII